MSGFRGSNLTKTMASLQDLESFEPLNPLTPDPDFGNLFCVFRQAIGKFLFAIPFFRASYWEIQHRAGPQICSLLASYREIAHNAENCSYSLVYCCKYNCLLGIALPQKTFLQRFYKPKKPFEKFLRAPMEDQGTKDGAVTGSKADQKKDSTEGPLSETEVCSDFGFIEPALKCKLWFFGGIAAKTRCLKRKRLFFLPCGQLLHSVLQESKQILKSKTIQKLRDKHIQAANPLVHLGASLRKQPKTRVC